MSPNPWQRALVTGASSGIGAALVRQLATAGVPVVAVARRADRLQALTDACALVEPLVADLHDRDQRSAVAARLAAITDPIDLLVNNAGFGATGAFSAVSVDQHLGQVDLNVAALVELSHAALGRMRADRRGWVLNVSSVASFVPTPGAATYAATKAFVSSFSRALTHEGSVDGVVVRAICPGLTRSEFHTRATAARTCGGLGRSAPGFMWMTAEEVADAGLRALHGRRAVVVTGGVNRLLVAGSRAVPAPIRTRIAARTR